MKRRVKRERGHVMIELALSAGVLVATMAGSFQFGYTFYVYNQLVSAVGNGGRYAAMRTYRAATPEDIDKGRRAIRNLVVFGEVQPAPDALPLVADLKPENVRVEWSVTSDGGPEAVDVSIVDYPINAIFGTVTLTGRPAVHFPFVGRYAPGEREP
jgi:Flp pilus assembly protein TadG